jgi:polyisoprenoid-binding protein YceI
MYWLQKFAVAVVLAGSTHAVAQAVSIDPERSRMTVYVAKAGLFSAFGHNHEIRAPIAQGSVDETSRSVEFVAEASRLTVLDPDLEPAKRAEVQQTMLGPKVLDVAQFPQIRFRSRTVEPVAENRWRVNGELTLHGQTRPFTLEVQSDKGRYYGSVRLRQRDFGITPVSVGGGTVKVKDEVRIEFEVMTAPR